MCKVFRGVNDTAESEKFLCCALSAFKRDKQIIIVYAILELQESSF